MNLLFFADYGSVGDGFLGFFKGFFGYPAILIGIFALVGSLIQRKKPSEVLISTLKTIIGFLIISGGAGVLSTTLGNLTSVIKNGFKLGSESGMDFIIPSNEAAMAWMTANIPDIMTSASIILILAMICNIILAKLSNLKYIYLTGHVAFYTSLALSIAMWMAGLKPMQNIQDTVIVLLSGSLFLGLYMVLSPAASAKLAAKIAGNENLALGHTGGFGVAISGIMGIGLLKLSKKQVLVSTENIRIPEKLKVLADNIVSLSLTMIVIYMTIMMIALGISGLDAFANKWDADGNATSWLIGNDSISKNVGNAIVYAFVQSLTFVAGIQIIIFGVKMFLGELIPAFSGIANKLIKGSKAAVEVQAFWPAAPNGVIFGFLASFFGGLVTFGILLGVHFSLRNGDSNLARYFPVVLPELFPHLFIGGTAAVFANYKGGIRGALIAPFIVGFIWAWFPVIYKDLGMVPSELTDQLLPNGEKAVMNSATFAEVDHIIAVIPFLLIKLNKWLWLGISVALFLAPIIISVIKNAFDKNKTNKTDVKTLKEEQIKDISLNTKDSKQVGEVNGV